MSGFPNVNTYRLATQSVYKMKKYKILSNAFSVLFDIRKTQIFNMPKHPFAQLCQVDEVYVNVKLSVDVSS